MSKFVTMRWPDGLAERVDAAAGDRGRTAFVVRVLESALSEGHSEVATPVQPDVKKVVDPAVSTRVPKAIPYKPRRYVCPEAGCKVTRSRPEWCYAHPKTLLVPE